MLVLNLLSRPYLPIPQLSRHNRDSSPRDSSLLAPIALWSLSAPCLRLVHLPAMLFSSLLSVLALHIFGAAAADAADDSASSHRADLAAVVKTTFPDADILGVRLVNGRPTKALVEVTNKEDGPIQISVLAGVLATTKTLPEEPPPTRASFAT
ncbi:hypothetical protein J3458_012798 [Metarhizium acridum]|uniref:uncharacterized protein n=1 Tax=Metarhizium acridum TaxID=92637 RepID=UPI001C6A905D|nr:hypothetical protein J3458_012798 [Metarhizium acridum]